jgi:hypothetical protein
MSTASSQIVQKLWSYCNVLRYRVIRTNPPFGKKSSVMVVTEEGDEDRQALTVPREDFWARTSNKQLNFVQHVKTLLEMNRQSDPRGRWPSPT